MILYSPSQIKTFRSCVRKWALEKIAGQRGPETAAQSLGKDVDDNNLQPYLRDGKPIDTSTEAGQIAASGLDWLPQPKWRGLEVQKHFVFPSPSKLGFGYQGYLDLWLPHGGQPGFDNELPVVADFKTTKNIRRYMKEGWILNEDRLRTDVQAQLYAVWAILETKSKEINLSWLYLQTKDARFAQPTQVTVTTDEVAAQFREIEETAKAIHLLRASVPDAVNESQKTAIEFSLTLPGNKDACGDYGGCPFRHHCFTLEDLFDAPSEPKGCAKEERLMPEVDLFAKLGKKKEAADATPAPAPEPGTPPTQEQIAAEPPLGINPPMAEGTPPGPPVGEKKRGPGRPKKGADAAPSDVPAPSGDAFDTAWSTLGAALKNFLRVAGVGL